jgi:excisionase family DNA binding protein
MKLQEETLLTVGDVARLFGVVPNTIRDWERQGRIQAQRTPGGVRVFRRGDLRRLEAELSKRRAG